MRMYKCNKKVNHNVLFNLIQFIQWRVCYLFCSIKGITYIFCLPPKTLSRKYEKKNQNIIIVSTLSILSNYV